LPEHETNKREFLKTSAFAAAIAASPSLIQAASPSGFNWSKVMDVVFQSLADVQKTQIAAPHQSIVSLAYATAGDLADYPMIFVRAASQPSHAGWIRSKDRYLPNGAIEQTNGGYWALSNSVVTPEMFGAAADGVTDDYIAISNAIDFVNKLNNYPFPSPPKANYVGSVFFPNMKYYCSQTIVIGSAAIALEGRGFGAGTYTTQISFPASVCGIQTPAGGYLTKISGLLLNGGKGTSETAHGIWTKSKVYIENCQIQNFSAHGIFLDSNSSSQNCNAFAIENTNILSVGKCGIVASGANANIGKASHIHIRNVGGCGIWDESYYGNTWDTIQIAGSGLLGCQTRTGCRGAGVTGADGKKYMVAPNQDTVASTTDPVKDNGTVWLLIQETSVSSLPAWASGDIYQFGAGICATSLGSVFTNIYVESGYSLPMIMANSFGIGGVAMFDITQDRFDTCTLGVYNGTFLSTSGIGSRQFNSARFGGTRGFITTQLGGASGEVDHGTILKSVDSIITTTFRIRWDRANRDICFFLGSAYPIILTDQNTTESFGRPSGSTVPGVCNFPQGIAIGYSANARVVQCLAAVPASGGAAQGEFVFNLNAASGGPLGWSCTKGGANASTAIWTPVNLSPPPCKVAQLPIPSSRNEGVRGMVTDSTVTLAAGLGNSVAGGGSNKTPVWSDGTNWRIG
jgi:hypothetical protein